MASGITRPGGGPPNCLIDIRKAPQVQLLVSVAFTNNISPCAHTYMTLPKALPALLLLLAFLFSDNAMLFGKHVAEDLSHATECFTSTTDGSPAPSQSGTGHHGEREGGDCCETMHSHAWAPCQSLALSYLPKLSSLLESEPFRHFPEVFLDLFIPPQNLA